MNQLDAPLSENELDQLNELLLRYGNDDSILDVSELDGFLTAVVSGPETILPSEWFQEVWGGPGHEPKFSSAEQAQTVMTLLTRHINSIARTLLNEPGQFEAMFNEHTDEDTGKSNTVVEEWCFGYVRGVNLRTPMWTRLPEELADKLSLIYLFGSEEFFSELDKLSEETIVRLQLQIEPVAVEIYQYWLQQRGETTGQRPMVNSGAKIGRNDPCPCGSGKKYKKCCGLN